MMHRSVIATLFIIAVWIAYDACFVLRSSELGLLTRLRSEPRSVTSPGLHFNLPFVTELERVDARVRLFESKPHPRESSGPAELVRAVVAHRVEDARAYRLSFDDDAGLGAALDAIAQAELAKSPAASSMRADLKSRGVSVLFVRELRVELEPAGLESTLAHMQSEFDEEAARVRAEAEAELAGLRANTEHERAALLASAYHEARMVRARADAESAAIYSAAYGKDPELAEFLQSLELYENAIQKENRLILSTRSRAFRTLDLPRTRGAQ